MGVAGVAGLATAVGNFVKVGFQAADAIGDAADRAGVAVESLSRLKFAAEQNDVEFGALTTAIKRWQVTLSEAAGGSKDASASLGLLQLSASRLKGLRLEDQLRLIADQFRRIKDPADQTRIAVELFGRSGEQLVPLLRQGGTAIGQLTDEADRLGITLDQKTVRSIDKADKALKKLKATLNSFGGRVAGSIAEAIVGPVDNLDAAERRLGELVERRDAILRGSIRLPGPERSRQLDTLNAQIEGAREGLEIIRRMEAEAEQIDNPLAIPAGEEDIGEVRIKARAKQVEGLNKLMVDFEEQTRTSLESANRQFEETKLKLQELFTNGAINAKQFAERLEAARLKFNEAIEIEPVQVSVTKVAETLSRQQRAVQGFVDTIKTGLANLAQSGEITGRAILRYLLSALTAKVLYNAIDSLGTALSKSLSGYKGKGAGFVNAIAGAFAAGGGESSGPRVVGEEGPELLFDSGKVMNRRQMLFAMGGGGGKVEMGDTTIVVQGSGDPETTAQLVEARIQQNNKKMLEQITRLWKQNGYGSLR